MKRHSDLWKEIITHENISLAFDKARKGKSKYSEVKKIERKRDYYLKEIQIMLENQTFQTSAYKIKKVYEPKERDIYVLPFYPDRIIQHCLMNVIEPIWDKLFIHDSYACRKGKGQHKASQRLMHFIRKSSKIRIFRKLKNNITNKYKLTELYIQSYLGSLNGWLKWASDERFKNKVYFKLQELYK